MKKNKNQRQYKQMERYAMFFDSKNQCCENGYTTQSHLQIQYNLHKITNTISTKWPFFTELEQKAVQFVWKHTHTHTHTPPDNQNNLEKGKQSCRNQAL